MVFPLPFKAKSGSIWKGMPEGAYSRNETFLGTQIKMSAHKYPYTPIK